MICKPHSASNHSNPLLFNLSHWNQLYRVAIKTFLRVAAIFRVCDAQPKSYKNSTRMPVARLRHLEQEYPGDMASLCLTKVEQSENQWSK
jgi:hypothetical protein